MIFGTPTELDPSLADQIDTMATFTAGVDDAWYLDQISGVAKDIASGNLNFALGRQRLQDAINLSSYNPDQEEAGTISDLGGFARRQLILETLVDGARGFAQTQEGQDPAVLNRWPAQELFRAESRVLPRNWIERWKRAAELAGDKDALRMCIEHERLIALKSSKIWQYLGSRDLFKDALGNSWPPFAFNSGMWVRDIDREEAVSLGLIDQDTQIQPQEAELTDGLQSTVDVTDERIRQAMLDNNPDIEFQDGAFLPKAA